MDADNQKAEENTLFVGRKELSVYILSLSMLAQKYDKILIKARGKNTSTAIDLGEIGKNRFNLKLESIKTATESFQPKGGEARGPINVSTVEIVLTK